jgi:hypothetical protein
MLSHLCEEIEKLKGRLKPMVCFYEEFDKDPLQIWERIQSGEHFNEGNCLELVGILKDKWKGKRKAPSGATFVKKVKVFDHLKSDEIKNREEIAGKHSDTAPVPSHPDNDKALPELMQNFDFKCLTPGELNNIKLSLKLTEEHAAQTEIQNKSPINPQASPDDISKHDLSISELNLLIDNFETLKPKEQINLLKFLNKLQVDDPEKFSKLD